MKIYLVTGGAGFIASNFIEQLLTEKKKIKIYSLDNYSTGKKENHINSSRVKYFHGDTEDVNKIFLYQKFDFIFHFGEFSRLYESFEQKNRCLDNNLNGTLKVLKFALKQKCPIFYSGTLCYYGNSLKDQYLSPYAWSKAKNVELIKNFAVWYNLKYIIVYFNNVYGPKQILKGKMASVIGRFVDQYQSNRSLTVVNPGTDKRNFTHVTDIVKACVLSLNKKLNSEYFLSDNFFISIIQVARLFNHKIKFISKRKGENFGKINKKFDGFKKLKYKPQFNIRDYIFDIINKFKN